MDFFRSTLMRLGVWLLLALLPLRALASVEMAVAMASAPAPAAAAVMAMPPCHGAEAAHDAAGSEVVDGTAATDVCACGLICAPAMPGAVVVDCGASAAGDGVSAAAPGTAPEGEPESLFRPPRG